MSKKHRSAPAPTVSLLPGEEIAFGGSGTHSTATDEELNRRYAKGEVRIVTETARYSLAGILQMLQERVIPEDGSEPELRYKLDPEYQRRHRWSTDRKSRLIESFLMNIPVPPVFLYERDLARFEVMDGRQRLTALSEFYDNQFPLTGLQYWPELHGRTHATLPSKVRDGIDRRYISSIILLKETASSEEQAAALKKIVFERLNSGGVALSPQETRNAVYDGRLNRLCLELSKNAFFRSMWGIPAEIDPASEDEEEGPEEPGEDVDVATNAGRKMFQRMDDVELVLRFFAYRQLPRFPGGLNRISSVLDMFLLDGNKFQRDLLDRYRKLFETTISFLSELLGTNAFHRLDTDGKPMGRPTKIVYDPLMYVASQYAEGARRTALLGMRSVLLRKLGVTYAGNPQLFSGRSTNSADAQERNARIGEAFQTALDESSP